MALFSTALTAVLRTLVTQHHTVYPSLPPQGVYFEALVERAFLLTRRPFVPIEPGTPNAPAHDLISEDQRISLKTETGTGTKIDRISITKLCTTEKDPWEAEALRAHALAHLARYDHMLMLRAVWDKPIIHYQAIDIPIRLLLKIKGVPLDFVGKQRSRRSIGGDAIVKGKTAFHVHFDGSDGKCQIRGLRVDLCRMIDKWDYHIPGNP